MIFKYARAADIAVEYKGVHRFGIPESAVVKMFNIGGGSKNRFF